MPISVSVWLRISSAFCNVEDFEAASASCDIFGKNVRHDNFLDNTTVFRVASFACEYRARWNGGVCQCREVTATRRGLIF